MQRHTLRGFAVDIPWLHLHPDNPILLHHDSRQSTVYAQAKPTTDQFTSFAELNQRVHAEPKFVRYFLRTLSLKMIFGTMI